MEISELSEMLDTIFERQELLTKLIQHLEEESKVCNAFDGMLVICKERLEQFKIRSA